MSYTKWKEISWKTVLKEVRQIQAKLVEAARAGDAEDIRRLQDQLVRTEAARLLAVHQVAANSGRLSPGIDGVIWATSAQKLEAAASLKPEEYEPKPARRVNIPKGNGKQRPLSILTMQDRAMQALYLFALDPVAETRADPHSYGFRKYRSAHDAIASCYDLFEGPHPPRYVLEADIKACFDSISHDWLLRNIPMDSSVLHKWLKVRYLEGKTWHQPIQGLPQGGIISPVLANLTLDGLEPLLIERFNDNPVYLVRYADDFLVFGSSKRLLRKKVQPLIAEFLAARGLQLAEEKTHVTDIRKGLDFLGFHLRQIKDTLRITVADQGRTAIVQRIQDAVNTHQDVEPAQLIDTLNPIIRGWANQFSRVDSQEQFVQVDREIAKILRKWAKHRHAMVVKHWKAKHYFITNAERQPIFTAPDGHTIYRASETPLTRHQKIEDDCNPYDPQWAAYLKQRTSPGSR